MLLLHGCVVGQERQHHPPLFSPAVPLMSVPPPRTDFLNVSLGRKCVNASVFHTSQAHSPHITMASPALQQSSMPTDDSPSRGLGEVTVVGAGPAGCLLAHYLLRRGFSVNLFEKRAAAPPPQPGAGSHHGPNLTRAGEAGEGIDHQVYAGGDSRSYTILLTSRAVKALEGAGLKLPPNLLNLLLGSCMHQPDGKKRLFNYSNEPGLLSFGVSRNALVTWLQQSLHEKYPKLKTFFEFDLESVDENMNIATFRPSARSSVQDKQKRVEVKYDLLVGADGVNSAVRSELFRLEQSRNPSDKKLEPLTMDFKSAGDSYKSFYVRPEIAKTSPLYANHNRVQSWPSLSILLVGMADGSFWGGSKNVELVHASTTEEVESIFRKKAPEVFDLLLQENKKFTKDFVKQPEIAFGAAVTLSRFHHDNIVLIGDAAHAMFPSYGTGCNAALEDCLLLDHILSEYTPSGNGDITFQDVAAEFTKRRLDDAHAIVKLNTTLELIPRGYMGILQSMLLSFLHKRSPKFFKPTSYQQLWSDTPFRQIELQKHAEDRLFYSLLLLLGFILIAGLLVALGVRPKLIVRS